jgi:glycosyltransferase involved in cell wall biosynthesis
MRFTFPILTLCIGGAQRMLAEITNGLVDRGHDVTILMPASGDVEYNIKAKIRRTNGVELRDADYPVADVIVSNYYTIVPSAQTASLSGKGIHVRFSLCYEPTFLPENHVTFPSYQATERLIVLSKWQREIIRLNHGIQGHIVPVGISSAFRNLKIRNAAAPLQISAIARLAEGTWSWHRDQPYLIEQLEVIKRILPQIEINLFCPPKEFAQSPTMNRLQHQGVFRVLTPLNDEEMCYHYNRSDIFVNSSTYDSASIPGLEAMKCGAALVTTYSGGNEDYCRHEENCLLSFRYENRLAHDIMRLIQNPFLRQKLAEEGEKEALKWTWQRSVTEFERAIVTMLGRGVGNDE